MSISIDELKRFGYIEKVIIHSIDLALYHVSVVIERREHYVYGNNGLPIKAYNKLELQTMFEKYKVGETYLRASSAYDEMIGQPIREEDNTLKVLLGNGFKNPLTNVSEH